MVQIFGKYQHVRDENLGEFKKILDNVYIEMLGMLNSELEITQVNETWKFCALTMGGKHLAEFDPNRDPNQYAEIMPSGRILECPAKRKGDSLLITFETKDGDVIIRKCQFTEDGATFTMQIAGEPLVAIRYFKMEHMSEKSELVRESSSRALVKSSPSVSKKSLSKPAIIAIAGATTALGAGAAIVAAPFVVAAAGFTASGIAAGSLAASMMSVFGGGATAAGGVIATLQSVGALGTVLGSTAATAAAAGTGAAAGAAVGAGIVHTNKNNSKQK